MTKMVTNPGCWSPGQSGNTKGRPAKVRALTETLRLKDEEALIIGGEEVSAAIAAPRQAVAGWAADGRQRRRVAGLINRYQAASTPLLTTTAV